MRFRHLDRHRWCSWKVCAAVLLIVGWLSPTVAKAADDLSFLLPEGQQQLTLDGVDARWQLVVMAGQGEQQRDVTDQVSFEVTPSIAQISADGYLTPLADGQARLIATLEQQQASLSVTISGMTETQPVNFPGQVVPIFTKLGCNGGGCHGKASGQAGFRLSLLGFEPQEDYEHLVMESRGRRLFPAAPDRSLLLMKAVNAAPHGGGQRLETDSHEYRLMRRWIATGMPYGNPDDPVVTTIEVYPAQRIVTPSAHQQLAVVAHFSDGHREDITRTVQFESNNTDLADVDTRGRVTIGTQPGDVAIMARYQGHVAVFRATVPLGAPVASLPPAINAIDQAVFDKLETLGLPPSGLADDATLVRRMTLDIAGRLPTVQETQDYVRSQDPDKVEQLVDRLLASDDYADFFARKWSMILRNRRESAGDQMGTFLLHHWIRQQLHQNRPYDQWVSALLTARGSLETNPAVAWWREVNETESRVEDAAQLFLGQRLQCARCHHHPFEKWSQKDYYQVAAFFSKVVNKESASAEVPVLGVRGGNAVAHHPRSGQALIPVGLSGQPEDFQVGWDPRQELVDWMTEPGNPFFARSLVNRYWKHFFATGLVEPEDDLRVTNPPTNPELMDALAREFVDSDYDLKALIRLICTSSTYRMRSDANQHNLGDTNSYSRYYPKRLSAEVLLDAIDQVVGTHTPFEGMPVGTRAIQLPDNQFDSYFLDVFGRPTATTACECERSQEATLSQSLHLLNSVEIQSKLSQEAGLPARLFQSSDPLDARITQLYLLALSREPTSQELETAREYLTERESQGVQPFEDLVWAILNSKEFLFNH